MTEIEKVHAMEKFDQNILEKLRRQMAKLESSIEYRDKILMQLRSKKTIALSMISDYKSEVLFWIWGLCMDSFRL